MRKSNRPAFPYIIPGYNSIIPNLFLPGAYEKFSLVVAYFHPTIVKKDYQNFYAAYPSLSLIIKNSVLHVHHIIATNYE